MPAHPVLPATTGGIAQRYDDYSRRYALLDLLDWSPAPAWRPSGRDG